jgi:hypothetical protein
MTRKFDRIFFGAGLLALLFMVVMAVQGHPLKTAATPAGILSLEFAKTNERVLEILHAWAYLNNTALWNTLIDFAFMLSYGFFFSRAVKYLAELRVPFVYRHSKAFQKLAWLPTLLDAIENLFILGWLLYLVPSFSPLLVYGMVVCKFLLAAFMVLLAFPAWVYNLFALLKRGA